MSRKLGKYLAVAAFVLSFGMMSVQADPIVDSKTRLAITGDSITEQRMYSRFIELYLTACAPQQPEAVFQFGWGGDRADGFGSRVAHDCLSFFKPTLMTTCYGMNDGGYGAFTDGIKNYYTNGMKRLLKNVIDANVKVLVGGPGAVDSTTYRRNADAAKMYNNTLSKLSEIAEELAKQNNMPFADVHKTCMDAMAKAKAELGANYVVMGNDGVHPGENGQLAMAFAFLKEMGFDGNIGNITLNLAASGNDRVTVQGEHDAKVADDGSVKITSRRWPFCFTGGSNDSSTLAMSRFLPFNETLNRFTLTVKGLDTPFGDVFWGGSHQRFTKEELEKGVNLAEAFAGVTPFQTAWGKLNGAVQLKQDFETFMIKNIRIGMRNSSSLWNGTDMKDELSTFWDAMWQKGWAAKSKSVQAAFQSVEHTIKVQPSTGQPIVIKSDITVAPEAAEYRVVYDLDLNKLRGSNPAYTTNVSKDAGEFTRIAYFLELGEGATATQWIWVSMDAFTNDAAKIGVPMPNTLFHQDIKNMTVLSNVPAIKSGTGMEGWVEFWPSNYSQGNVKKVPNASDATFDWGDAPGTGVGYGSMQVHNPAEKQVLFAINNWRANGPDKMDLGIGNQPQGNPDYTFSNNSGKYKFKRLQVLVK